MSASSKACAKPECRRSDWRPSSLATVAVAERRNQRSHTELRCVPGPDGGTLPGPAVVSNGGQRMLPPRGRSGSGCASFLLGLACSRSRRSSSRRARIVAKSSAARGPFTAFPPILVTFEAARRLLTKINVRGKVSAPAAARASAFAIFDEQLTAQS